MKRVRCPKCENYIIFDESKYSEGKALVFKCDHCGKQFGVRIGQTKLHGTRKEEAVRQDIAGDGYGYLTVIENAFHYKQTLPLTLGDNVIGRHTRGGGINCSIETCDPSMDETHCTINISRNKRGELVYKLKDGPSNTGTFVGNDILGDREYRIIEDGTLFTIGATSIILHVPEAKQ